MSDAVDISEMNLDGRITEGDQITWGGFSTISQGTLLRDGDIIEVAIKLLRVQGHGGPEVQDRLRKRFYREVLLWRKLRHSNVVPLLGYILRQNESPALVSPWYINGNVINYLKLHPNVDRHDLVRDVADGLVYLHSVPIAHGDLKGENVLVDANGRASLCDFGMSQFIDETNRITGFTTTNATIGGTDRFLCPELLEDKPKTTATDMWAAGCLIVQILTDEIPYQHIIAKHAVYFAIIRGEHPSTNRNETIDNCLWDLIRRSWNVSPDERPRASEILTYFALSANLKGFVCSSEQELEDVSGIRIQFSPDGRRLAVANSHGVVGIYASDDGALTLLETWVPKETYDKGTYVINIAWSASQHHLLVRLAKFLKVFVVETGELLVDMRDVQWANFYIDNALAFLESNGDLSFKELPQLENVLLTINIGSKTPAALCISPDQQRVMVLSRDVLSVYSLSTAKVETKHKLVLGGRGRAVLCVSKDCRLILISNKTLYADLWTISPGSDRAETQLSHLRRYSPMQVHRVLEKFQFGGVADELILAVLDGRSVCIWDRDTAMMIYHIKVDRSILSMSFRWDSMDPTNSMLVVATKDQDSNTGSLQVWSVESLAPETDTLVPSAS